VAALAAWPGNIRQLRQTIDRAVLIRGGRSSTSMTSSRYAMRRGRAAEEPSRRRHDDLDEMEKRMIVKCFKHYDGNVSRAAEALGISRAALYRRMEKYGIEG
jgi:transcriptional regulator with PAS, ATPase and Fis domain